uniref:Podocalyxin n=1 Tax=Iconisemion striatum TaxID=60296 RepID=A0A1A7Z326_9TELE
MRVALRITWLLLLLSMCSADEENTTLVTQKHSVVASVDVTDSTAVVTTTKAPDTKATTAAPPITTPVTEAAAITPKPEPTTITAPVTTTIITTTAKPETTQPSTVGTSNSPTHASDDRPLGTNPPSPTVTVSKPTTITQVPVGNSSPRAESTTLQGITSFKPTEITTLSSSDGNNQNAATNAEITTPSVGMTSGQHIDATLPVTQGSDGETNKVTPTTPELASTQSPSTVNPAVTFTTSILNKATTTVGTSYTTAETTMNKTTNTITAKTKTFTYSLLSGQETKEEKDLVELCKKLMPDWQSGTCILTWRHHNSKVQFDSVEINGKVKTSLANKYYEEMTKEDPPEKPTDYKTLIAILASCGALLIMIVILTVCATHHRKPCNENQQYLTEELHTVENCYHDNPTLEVMEVQPEMQEKKMVLNGEFNDSWIVPIDNLMKEDLPDEEDTHL